MVAAPPTLRSVCLMLVFLLVYCIPVRSQPKTEKGHYLSIRNFTTEDYHARPQNWDITEDKRGILYFGNTSGILVYDGLSWSKIDGYDEIIYSLEADKDGIVFAGGENDFGTTEFTLPLFAFTRLVLFERTVLCVAAFLRELQGSGRSMTMT